MRHVVSLICVGLFLNTAATAFAQQQRLFVRMPSEIVELDPRPASLGTVIGRFPLPEGAGIPTRNVVPFGGGRFLAWVGEGVLLLDTLSGAVQRFTFPGFSPDHVLGTDGNARLVVLGTNGTAVGGSIPEYRVLVADARSGSWSLLDLGSTARGWTYAAASDVLFVAREKTLPSGFPLRYVDVIQAGTGALLKTLEMPLFSGPDLLTNTAGTRLFVGNFGADVFVFDVVSGRQLAANRSISGRRLLDEYRNRLLAYVDNIDAFSADSLTYLGKALVPRVSPPPPELTSSVMGVTTKDLDVSGLSATMFELQGLQGTFKSGGMFCKWQLTALDVDTGRVRQTVNTTDALEAGTCQASLVRITEPPPPSAPIADVSGHQVTLRWPLSLGATRYEVEAGAAPGLTNVVIDVTDPQLVVDAIPSGVYYVRVRAINTIGASRASEEIQLSVP